MMSALLLKIALAELKREFGAETVSGLLPDGTLISNEEARVIAADSFTESLREKTRSQNHSVKRFVHQIASSKFGFQRVTCVC